MDETLFGKLDASSEKELNEMEKAMQEKYDRLTASDQKSDQPESKSA